MKTGRCFGNFYLTNKISLIIVNSFLNFFYVFGPLPCDSLVRVTLLGFRLWLERGIRKLNPTRSP